MANVIALNTDLMQAHRTTREVSAKPAKKIEKVSQAKREKALLKSRLINEIMQPFNQGLHTSVNQAIDSYLLRAELEPKKFPLVYQLGRKGKAVSRASLYNWVKAFEKSGSEGLIEKRGGSKPKQHEWEAMALQLYNQPTKPYIKTVMYWLRERGFKVEYSQLRAFIRRLPVNATELSRKRLGSHYYDQNIAKYTTRDTSVIPVGHTWMADGHACDVYVAHPSNGKPWIAELTVWMDQRSNYVVGWHISSAESTMSSLESLAAAIDQHQHVPANIYVDPGPGFKNKVFTTGENSFCARMGIRPTFAIAGNAKGKGLIEGWFRWFEERVGKKFNTHKSNVRTDDTLRMLTAKVKQGKIILPTLAEYTEEIARYVEFYNNNPQKKLGCSPAKLWATLERVEPVLSVEELAKPSHERVVQKGGRINFANRAYYAAELMAYIGKTLVIWVTMRDASTIDVKDEQGRLICRAAMVEAKPGIGASVLEDDRRRSQKQKLHRLKIKEINMLEQSRDVIDAQTLSSDPAFIDSQSTVIEHEENSDTDNTEINIEDLYL